MRGARAFIEQRRATARAEMANGLGGLVLVTRDARFALGDPQPLAPASDIGRVRRAMGAAARGGMIMPSPARRRIDLEADLTAQALALGDADGFCCFCQSR